MINCRAPPGKFKKKIAELLNQVFRENDEFDAKYAPLARKKIQGPAASAAPQGGAQDKRREVEVFDQSSREFEEAVRKISPEILDLIEDQFKCSPSALLRGAFQESKEENIRKANIEDEQISQEFEDAQDVEEDGD